MAVVQEQRQSDQGVQTVDVAVRIPELVDIAPFWMRGVPLHQTFGALYEACVNHPEARRSRKSLAHVRASRHFWCGERMMLRGQTLADALTRGNGSSNDGNGTETALVLRPDYYRIGPPQYVAGRIEYTYLDAEAPAGALVTQVLNTEEKSRCFDLCDARGKRLASDQPLAHYELWPAWQEAASDDFPVHATLRLRPRTSWLPLALLAVAALAGTGTGYLLLCALLAR